MGRRFCRGATALVSPLSPPRDRWYRGRAGAGAGAPVAPPPPPRRTAPPGAPPSPARARSAASRVPAAPRTPLPSRRCGPRAPPQEVRDQRPQILGALAQRRDDQRFGAQAAGQVAAQPLPAGLGRGPGGGRQHPHVQRAGGDAAQRLVAARLQEAQQLGLRPGRHVADLVEEQRAAVGPGQQARPALAGLRVRPAGEPEQLALHQLDRQGRAVDGQERTRAPAGGVDGLGVDLLAHAGLAGQQHLLAAGRQPPQPLQQHGHGRGHRRRWGRTAADSSSVIARVCSLVSQRNTAAWRPIRMTSPSTSLVGSAMRRPLTKVPLREPRSTMCRVLPMPGDARVLRRHPPVGDVPAGPARRRHRAAPQLQAVGDEEQPPALAAVRAASA